MIFMASANPWPAKEGFVPFHGHRTWYRIVGDRDAPGKAPLLVLHGGPGVPHDYLEALEAFAGTGRRVVFYDQLGCGNSDKPGDPSMWTIPLFVEEFETMRAALGLDRFHLLGHSWGGMLAIECALKRPRGLRGLVLASAPASMQQWMQEANRLRAALPKDVQATLEKHEKEGTTEDPAYMEAMMVFYARHVCRLDPWPEPLQRAFGKLMENPEVYATMNGPSEFNVTGVIRTWDRRASLKDIRYPTLVTSGRHDEATPAIAETLQKGIPGAEWEVFEESSHVAHAEETEKYLRVLDRFLARVEASG